MRLPTPTRVLTLHALNLVKEASDALPPLKGATNGVAYLINVRNDRISLREDWITCRNDTSQMLVVLHRHFKEDKCEESEEVIFLHDLLCGINTTCDYVINKLNKRSGILYVGKYRAKLDGLRHDLEQAWRNYQYASERRSAQQLSIIKSDTSVLRNDTSVIRQDTSRLVAIQGTINFVAIMLASYFK